MHGGGGPRGPRCPCLSPSLLPLSAGESPPCQTLHRSRADQISEACSLCPQLSDDRSPQGQSRGLTASHRWPWCWGQNQGPHAPSTCSSPGTRLRELQVESPGDLSRAGPPQAVPWGSASRSHRGVADIPAHRAWPCCRPESPPQSTARALGPARCGCPGFGMRHSRWLSGLQSHTSPPVWIGLTGTSPFLSCLCCSWNAPTHRAARCPRVVPGEQMGLVLGLRTARAKGAARPCKVGVQVGAGVPPMPCTLEMVTPHPVTPRQVSTGALGARTPGQKAQDTCSRPGPTRGCSRHTRASLPEPPQPDQPQQPGPSIQVPQECCDTCIGLSGEREARGTLKSDQYTVMNCLYEQT